MATKNFFELLGDDENDDPSVLIERAGAAPAPAKELKKQPAPTPVPVAKLPTKPTPPAQAVRESQGDGGRGRGVRGGRTGGRGNYGNRERYAEGGYNRPPREGDFQGNEQNDRSFNSGKAGFNASFNGEGPAGGEEGGRSTDGSGRVRGRGRGRGRGYGYLGDGEERPRHREYDRRSGTGRGNEVKREGAGRGNWGVEIDPESVVDTAEAGVEEEKAASSEATGKKAEDVQPEVEDAEKKVEVEEEDKEMTLEEYEKVLSEKRKNLEALKAKERKVVADKDFAAMQLVEKKNEEEVFLKLGAAEKGKKKEVVEKDERLKKPVNINEFLRPAEGEGYYSPSGRRGRGSRGRGERGGFRGGYGNREATAPSIEDPSHFPTLGGK